MDENKRVLPLIPLRGITIFPYMVMNFDVGREKSILALEKAMTEEQEIFLVPQKDSNIDEPQEEDILKIGTVCSVKQLLKLPDNNIRLLVEGKNRARLENYDDSDEYIKAEISILEDLECSDNKCEALFRILENDFDEYVDHASNILPEALLSLEDFDSAGRVCDIISSLLMLKQESKHELLEAVDVKERLEKLIVILKNELEIVKLEKKLGKKVKKNMDKLQKEYYLREQMKAIQEELGVDEEEDKEIKSYKAKIVKAKLPKEAKEKAKYELKRLESSGSYSPEGGIIKTYLDNILDLPWNAETKDNLDIKNAREILDKEHFGLEDVKERVIEYLAVSKMSNSMRGPILCLVGPPGVGKTSIAKSIANCVGRKFVRMSLGGVRDESDIRGHRKTYIGAIPGRIIYGMKQVKVKNPLFLLDEIDKMSSDFRGNPADALLEVLDSEQNSTFRDHYLELDFDLSKVLFITTANSLETIPGPLLDRMEIIEVSGYTYEEKFHIAKKYLVPKQLEQHKINSEVVSIEDESLKSIIGGYTRESGVRGLERKIARVIRKSISEMLEKDNKNIVVTVSSVETYLGPAIFTYDKIDVVDKVGVVTGMAWTGYGGDTLPVEVSVMKGTGKLELTGQLGDVMKESAKTGYSYVRAHCESYGINGDFYKEKDMHIHVPEGAVPKDGPSAGVTMITAIISALSGRAVKHNVAMTGEITLTGRVLAIGGLKEKCLAAYRAGIDTVIIPKENEKDMIKLPESIKSKLRFILAEKIEDVLENALVGEMNNGN